ncbi:MAG: DUF937 domain-containing protein [Bacteroidota bacterium]
MTDLFDLLKGQLDDNLIGQLSNQLGGADRQQTQKAAQGAISTLVSALAKNAANPEKAAGLNNALDNDHDGSILDNITDLIGGNLGQQHSRAGNGAGIIKHLLGPQQSGAIDMISKMSGLDSGKSGNMLATLAPIVMGMLGKQKRQGGMDIGAIAGLLSNSVNNQRSSGNPMLDMANRFLDQDGDGSALDDVAGMVGKGLLGKLFGGK